LDEKPGRLQGLVRLLFFFDQLCDRTNMGREVGMLKEAIEEVLALQKRYSSSPAKTQEMQRRGELIRNVIPELLRKYVGATGYSVTGRDAMGRPSRVPWVRVFDEKISPSATEGKYAVFLFAADGSAVFLSLNQATTERHGRIYPPKATDIVSKNREDARSLLRGRECDLRNLLPDIQLNATGTGHLYEAGNIYSLGYGAGSVPRDARIYADLSRILSLWNILYPNAKSGPNPGGMSAGAQSPAPMSSQNVFQFVAKASSATSTSALALLTDTQRKIVLEHNIMQEALYKRLVEDYGKDHVRCENSTGFETRIDVVVRQENRYRFYEIKTDPSPRICLRQAIGQLLEYAFFGLGRPDEVELIVVGRMPIDEAGDEYLQFLESRFNLSIEYETVEEV
jgi:hypothetical protein